jgi:hypothetical protein
MPEPRDRNQSGYPRPFPAGRMTDTARLSDTVMDKTLEQTDDFRSPRKRVD